MSPRCSWQQACACRGGVWYRGRVVRIGERHHGPRRQSVLAARDNGFPGAQAFVDQRLAVECFAPRDWPHRDLTIRVNDKDVLPLRPLLDGIEWDGQTIVL